MVFEKFSFVRFVTCISLLGAALVLGCSSDDKVSNTGKAVLAANEYWGVYIPESGTMDLRASLSPGVADASFGLSLKGNQVPLLGNWRKKGVELAVFDRANCEFVFFDSLFGGQVIGSYRFECVGSQVQPIVGDWKGDGYSKVGVFSFLEGSFLSEPNLQ